MSALGEQGWKALADRLDELDGAVVAFSGGVDSTVLLAACAERLGRERVVAVIAESPSLARTELVEAVELADRLGVRLQILATRELEDPRYLANAGDRCFWCKEALFSRAVPLAAARGWTLVYGENADDARDDRPGARSAVMRGVRAPLREAGWSKSAVRAFARERGLPVADKPAMPCLASRLPTGVQVTRQALAQVESLEASLRRLGFRIVRARHLSDDRVRLEFGPEDQERARGREPVLEGLAREAGYREVEIDPRGYRSGSVAAGS